MTDQNFIEVEYKQRAYDGKWEKIAKIVDHENAYIYATESGAKVSIVPEKWITVGVYDLMGEFVD